MDIHSLPHPHPLAFPAEVLPWVPLTDQNHYFTEQMWSFMANCWSFQQNMLPYSGLFFWKRNFDIPEIEGNEYYNWICRHHFLELWNKYLSVRERTNGSTPEEGGREGMPVIALSIFMHYYPWQWNKYSLVKCLFSGNKPEARAHLYSIKLCGEKLFLLLLNQFFFKFTGRIIKGGSF